MVATLVYFLCMLTCLLCFALLLRAWLTSRSRILFWSALCFAGLSANNFLLAVDKLVVSAGDLSLLRLATALVAMLLLLFGLIWGEE